MRCQFYDGRPRTSRCGCAPCSTRNGCSIPPRCSRSTAARPHERPGMRNGRARDRGGSRRAGRGCRGPARQPAARSRAAARGRGLGRPVEPSASVCRPARLTGITLYEPAELVIGARAGTPLADDRADAGRGKARAAVRADGLPARCSARPASRRSAGRSRPTSPARGASRPAPAATCFIGVRFVNGRGEVVKSGGRVMKNVTGLDLVKLNAGAHGTLGLLTEVTFKVLPMPRDRRRRSCCPASRMARHGGAVRRPRLALRGDGRRASAGRDRRRPSPDAAAARRLWQAPSRPAPSVLRAAAPVSAG